MRTSNLHSKCIPDEVVHLDWLGVGWKDWMDLIPSQFKCTTSSCVYLRCKLDVPISRFIMYSGSIILRRILFPYWFEVDFDSHSYQESWLVCRMKQNKTERWVFQLKLLCYTTRPQHIFSDDINNLTNLKIKFRAFHATRICILTNH